MASALFNGLGQVVHQIPVIGHFAEYMEWTGNEVRVQEVADECLDEQTHTISGLLSQHHDVRVREDEPQLFPLEEEDHKAKPKELGAPPVIFVPLTAENLALHTSGGSTLHASSDYGDYRRDTLHRWHDELESLGGSERYGSEVLSVTSQEDLQHREQLHVRSDLGDHRPEILALIHNEDDLSMFGDSDRGSSVHRDYVAVHRPDLVPTQDRVVHGSPHSVVHTDRSPLLGARSQGTGDWGIFEWLHQILIACGCCGGLSDSAVDD